MKDGSALCTPSANWTCGFLLGLEPPRAGCRWQLPQLLLLNRGPRPLLSPLIVCSSANWPCPLLKKLVNPVVVATDPSGKPAPTAPPRTPGSCAPDCPTTILADDAVNTRAARAAMLVRVVTLPCFLSSPEPDR